MKRKPKPLSVYAPGTHRGNTKIWFVIPDCHIPEEDKDAMACMMKAHSLIKPDYTIQLGDLLDCAMFSMHPKRSISESLAYDFKTMELDPANLFWDQLQKDTRIHSYYLLGNHSDRIERWASTAGQTAQSIFSMLSPVNTIAKGRKNFTVVPYQVPTGDRMGYVQIAPDLVAVHGWSFARNAAQVHLQKSRSKSVVYGHTHRAEMIASRDPWTGTPIKAFSPGCLSKLQPLYAHGGSPTDWSHGFCIIYVGQKSWTDYIIQIFNGGCVLPDGREIR